MQIREVMTESVVTAPPDCPVRRVAELMRERNVGSVVLVDGDGRPVGFLTDRDLAISVLADSRDATDPAEAHASAPVITADPSMEVRAAADLMVEHGVRRLPIIDGERMVGILTLADLAVRLGDPGMAAAMTSEITRASNPTFYFHERGG
jgi:CBS domain-containing protein